MIKKLAGVKVIFLIEMIISSLIFSGCYNSLSDLSESNHGRKSRVQISIISRNIRTLLPNQDFTKYVLIFESDTASHGDVVLAGGDDTDTAVFVELFPGVWSIKAVGYCFINGTEYPAVEGIASITLETGQTRSVEIIINATQNGDDGFFGWAVTFPENKIRSAALSLTIPGDEAGYSVNLLSEQTGMISCAPGAYHLKIVLQTDIDEVVRTEIVHIYSNMETIANYFFAREDFAELITFEIRFAGLEDEPITVSQSLVDGILACNATPGYDNYQWMVDGAILDNQTSEHINLFMDDYNSSFHSCLVIAQKGNKFYSKEITFRGNKPMLQRGNLGLSVDENMLVWGKGKHTAFTSLVKWKGDIYLSFREANGHNAYIPENYGAIRILKYSNDSWTEFAVVSDPEYDLRDPSLSVTPDDKLLLLCGRSKVINGSQKNQGNFFSICENDTFSIPQPINHDIEHMCWIWKVHWSYNKAYGVAYASGQKPTLLSSDNGIDWVTVTKFDLTIGNEAAINIIDDVMVIVMRTYDNSTYIGHALYPYQNWTWKDLGLRIESPHLTYLTKDRKLLLSGRFWEGDNKHTSIFEIQDNKINHLLNLNTTEGDCGYPCLIELNESSLFCSYYSGNAYEANIYLAIIGKRSVLY